VTSGQYITWSMIVYLFGVFLPWELIQLARRRAGNKSALTMSQFVTRKAEGGHRLWKWFVVLFPVFVTFLGVWLFFHWQAPCFAFGWLCGVEV
jgi:uncharacterized membrane protein